jgi:outer membrane receptor protein involved in Fe transport
VPYAPQHTLTARLNYRIPLRSEWLDSVELGISLNGAGRIYWNERNDFSQPFYALVNASARLNGANWAVEIWARNVTDARYDTFYFESMSNRFLQRGRPLTVGIRASIELFANRSN